MPKSLLKQCKIHKDRNDMCFLHHCALRIEYSAWQVIDTQ